MTHGERGGKSKVQDEKNFGVKLNRVGIRKSGQLKLFFRKGKKRRMQDYWDGQEKKKRI